MYYLSKCVVVLLKCNKKKNIFISENCKTSFGSNVKL